MAIYVSERRLLPAFRNRNVVFQSKVFTNVDNILMVNFELEFGASGAFRRKCVLDFRDAMASGVNGKKFDDCYEAARERLTNHISAIRSLGLMFDEVIDWVENGTDPYFLSKAVGVEPLFIHCSRDNKNSLIEIFGRDINKLNLGIDGRNRSSVDDCLNRLHGIGEVIEEHLETVTTLKNKLYSVMTNPFTKL